MIADDIPACGYRTFSIPAESRSVSIRSDNLENEFFKIRVDAARGCVSSIVDKRTGRDWVDADAAQGFGQYLNERFSYTQTAEYCREYQQGRWGSTLHPGMHKPGMPKETPYRAASPNRGAVTITHDGIRTTAVLDMPSRPDEHLPASSLRVTLYRGQPFIDLGLTIKDKALDNWPEADWLCLPLNVADPQFLVSRTLGAMDTARDILRGANRHIYAAGTGVTVRDADGKGMAICPIDHPLISLDTPGCWKFSLDFVPRKPIVFVNLYNNQWNTNYRYWYPGTWSSRVRLWPIEADTPVDRALNIPAIEARHPLLAVEADGPAGQLPDTRTGVHVSRPGVLITAFADNPTGPGTMLRLWEQAGAGGRCTVRLPLPASKATPVNLRGEQTGDPLDVNDGQLQFHLPAFAPASFLLQ
jgi:hypothetical protein